MKEQSTANLLLGLFVIIVSVAMYQVAETFEGDARDRAFPQLLLILAVVIGVALITREFWKTKKLFALSWSLPFSRRQVSIIIVSSIYPIAAFWLGFYSSAFLFLTIFPWIILKTAPGVSQLDREREGLRSFIMGMASAGLFVGFLYVSFWHLLRILFPQGIWV